MNCDFKVGDIVTRTTDDLHRILEVFDNETIKTVCVKEPLGLFEEDGPDGQPVRGEPWCKVGFVDIDLRDCFSYPDELLIEGSAESDGRPSGRPFASKG